MAEACHKCHQPTKISKPVLRGQLQTLHFVMSHCMLDSASCRATAVPRRGSTGSLTGSTVESERGMLCGRRFRTLQLLVSLLCGCHRRPTPCRLRVSEWADEQGDSNLRSKIFRSRAFLWGDEVLLWTHEMHRRVRVGPLVSLSLCSDSSLVSSPPETCSGSNLHAVAFFLPFYSLCFAAHIYCVVRSMVTFWCTR